MQESKLVAIRVCQGLLPAEVYKSKLEAMGIPVLLRYEAAGVVFGITVDGLGEVRVLVPQAFAAAAEELLAEAEPEGGMPVTEPEVGSESPDTE